MGLAGGAGCCIARDRFGEKPLYWGVFDNTLLFASEPKVLLAHPSVKPSLNLQALRQYLSFDYVPAPLSIYEGINKLPAAHMLTLEDGEVETSTLLAPELQDRTSRFRPKLKPPNTCSDCWPTRCACVWFRTCRWECCFRAASILRAIAALAVRASSEAVKTFSISFAESSFDESSYARGVAKFLGTDHHEERLSANLAANLVSEIGSWMDEPFSDPSLVPTYLLVALHAQACDRRARRRWRR